MQSQLEAALLGHSATNVASSSQNDDEDNNYQDEREEDIMEELIDEDLDGADNGHRPSKSSTGASSTPRTVTLQMLLAADILQPGKGTMTIEYLGQKFVGDLLEDGKIRSQETDIVFASPSAWAIACKRFINPDKKSGCGWASVKYRGKKLDAYKNVWYKKKKEEQNQDRDQSLDMDALSKNLTSPMSYHRMVVKHNTIANRTLTHDANTLIECVPFSNLGKIQPFLVSLSTNAALVMDFHCHLTKTEVCGYLAGHWDFNSHTLQISQAFPCRNTKSDRENAPQVEAEISKAIEKESLILVGWYHSHPYAAATPTLRDVDAQLDYQIKMKGTSDNSYSPCIGVIISPYNYENNSLESNIIAYWVIPPPEAKPNEYGRPMLMSYSVVQDIHLTPTIKDEMRKCVDYYKKEADFINFSERFLNGTYYIDKLKNTLISKFPRDDGETVAWRFIKEILGYSHEENESLLSIPSVGKPSLIPGLNPASFMLPTDISSLLFNSGKFPSASSLLGLPDPMAHSTLAANNMFLSTNLFKMQELLKPLSTSSPLPKTTTSTKHSPSIKIPTDLKHKDYYPDYKSFITPETKSKMDYSELFGTSSGCKKDYTIPDLSKSPDFSTLNLSRGEFGDRPSKMAKNDFTMDLSSAYASTKSTDDETPTDLSAGVGENTNEETAEEKPLNLVAAEPNT